VEVHCALIEYENGKVKSAHYLVQIVNVDDLMIDDKIVSTATGVISDPALARAIGFYNTYYQTHALIEQGRTLMHCGNTSSAYHNEFTKYMKVVGAALEDIFDYLFNVGGGKFLSEKRKKYPQELFEK